MRFYPCDYRKGSKKAKAHLGFDINRSIPKKIFLTTGKGDERPFVSQILDRGQTGIMDRGYQCHKNFDRWQREGKHFVCRIKANTNKVCIKTNKVEADSIVFYDAIVLLGTPGVNQTQKEVRLVGYTVDRTKYWVATDRHDLRAEQIALVCKLRWDIEKFFAWWKRHLRVYHLIARSEHGLMVQILAGLITYLLLAIYCHEQHGEKVNIQRVRELRNMIQNKSRQLHYASTNIKKMGKLGETPYMQAPNRKLLNSFRVTFFIRQSCSCFLLTTKPIFSYSYMFRAHSSAWQSRRLITGWSLVRIQVGPPCIGTLNAQYLE